ncbi:TPA: hypothetical protein ACGJRO_005014 [Pseudomonas aeruginosa]|uniref:hypothetical protein n=1 Tax=Pseudomonas aeruginosa TaxID=287 RepID=UPI000B094FC7|nr:hypothetical protein [Pseudomonas aeruginosa]
MAELNVIFDVPEAIAEGLKNGVYERIGGVIRRVGDKQIVMWLQEGVLLERDTAEQLLKQGPSRSSCCASRLSSCSCSVYSSR